MRTLLLAAILGWSAPSGVEQDARSSAGKTGVVEEKVPGTEATDRGNPGTTGRGGDVLTPGTEKDMELTPREVERTGTEVRPGLKPTGFLAAGLLVAAIGFTIGRRRRHRGRGLPSGPPPGPRV